MAVNSSPVPFAGRAIYRDGTLRVEGQARYPNDSSTATLEPHPDESTGASSRRAFSLVFHRDKEPYCAADLIGPVVHYSRSADLASVDVIRVINLALPPFNLPPPLRLICEQCSEANGLFADRSLALYRVADLYRYVS
jgi:hypothetical protein